MNSNTLAATPPAVEQTLTPAELDQARLYLQQTQLGITGAMKGLSDAQWAYKAAPGQWSIAEIVEHVIFVQERVLGPIRDELASAPGAHPGYDYKRVDEIVIAQFPNRLTKFPSPHTPVGDLARAEALGRVAKNYGLLAEYLESTSGLREHAIEAAPLKALSKGTYQKMDGYQWILAVAAHTERHTKQILEVKTHGSFPAN